MRIIIIIGLLAGLVLFLSWRFPYALSNEGDKMHLLYLSTLLLLVAGGARLGRDITLSHAAKQVGVWVAIFIVLVLGYSFRHQLKSELVPNSVRIASDGALSVRSAEDGHFYIEAEVNGAPVNFLVDTGASNIVLSPSDARRAGFNTDTLGYTRQFSTANGVGAGAPVRISMLTVGGITLHDLPASVNKAHMENSLLGMDFLKELKSYSVDGDVLTLVP